MSAADRYMAAHKEEFSAPPHQQQSKHKQGKYNGSSQPQPQGPYNGQQTRYPHHYGESRHRPTSHPLAPSGRDNARPLPPPPPREMFYAEVVPRDNGPQIPTEKVYDMFCTTTADAAGPCNRAHLRHIPNKRRHQRVPIRVDELVRVNGKISACSYDTCLIFDSLVDESLVNSYEYTNEYVSLQGPSLDSEILRLRVAKIHVKSALFTGFIRSGVLKNSKIGLILGAPYLAHRTLFANGIRPQRPFSPHSVNTTSRPVPPFRPAPTWQTPPHSSDHEAHRSPRVKTPRQSDPFSAPIRQGNHKVRPFPSRVENASTPLHPSESCTAMPLRKATRNLRLRKTDRKNRPYSGLRWPPSQQSQFRH